MRLSCARIVTREWRVKNMAMPVWYVFGLWIAWMLQFVLFRVKEKGTPAKTAPNSRWGMLVQVLGNWAIFLPARNIAERANTLWRIVAGAVFGLVGIWLASTGVRHLGKQWRMVAAHQPRPSARHVGTLPAGAASHLCVHVSDEHHERSSYWGDFPGGPSE